MINRWLVVPYKKYRKKIKSDPQRHKVYSMERELIGQSVNTRSTRDHLRSVSTHACRKYKVEPVRLFFVKDERRVFGWCNDKGIYLNSAFHGCNMYTLLHELAHYICDELKGIDLEGHGPEFFRIYVDLMHRYRIMPEVAMRAMADKYGIDY